MGRFHQESFGASSFAEPIQKEVEESGVERTSSGLTVTFLGAGKDADCLPGQTILEAARHAGVRIPSACQSGICGTCRVLKRSGNVDMRHNGGISQQDISAGYVLACCSRPLSPVEVDA